MKSKNSCEKIGWKDWFVRFLAATILYSVVAHIIAPAPAMNGMETTAGTILSVVVVYAGMFICLYLIISVISLICLKLTRNRLHITNALTKSLIPSLIVGALLLFGSWYGRTH
jgi:hypothetical protein